MQLKKKKKEIKKREKNENKNKYHFKKEAEIHLKNFDVDWSIHTYVYKWHSRINSLSLSLPIYILFFHSGYFADLWYSYNFSTLIFFFKPRSSNIRSNFKILSISPMFEQKLPPSKLPFPIENLIEKHQSFSLERGKKKIRNHPSYTLPHMGTKYTPRPSIKLRT